jgi:hypothetical protein
MLYLFVFTQYRYVLLLELLQLAWRARIQEVPCPTASRSEICVTDAT